MTHGFPRVLGLCLAALLLSSPLAGRALASAPEAELRSFLHGLTPAEREDLAPILDTHAHRLESNDLVRIQQALRNRREGHSTGFAEAAGGLVLAGGPIVGLIKGPGVLKALGFGAESAVAAQAGAAATAATAKAASRLVPALLATGAGVVALAATGILVHWIFKAHEARTAFRATVDEIRADVTTRPESATAPAGTAGVPAAAGARPAAPGAPADPPAAPRPFATMTDDAPSFEGLASR